jgi:hypothetical protein
LKGAAAPVLSVVIFILLDNMKIAKRGKDGTPQADHQIRRREERRAARRAAQMVDDTVSGEE